MINLQENNHLQRISESFNTFHFNRTQSGANEMGQIKFKKDKL